MTACRPVKDFREGSSHESFETNKCEFCDDIKTCDHLFFQCIFSEALWTDMQDWLHTKIRLEPFSQKDIIYGVVMDNNEWDFL